MCLNDDSSTLASDSDFFLKNPHTSIGPQGAKKELRKVVVVVQSKTINHKLAGALTSLSVSSWRGRLAGRRGREATPHKRHHRTKKPFLYKIRIIL